MTLDNTGGGAKRNPLPIIFMKKGWVKAAVPTTRGEFEMFDFFFFQKETLRCFILIVIGMVLPVFRRDTQLDMRKP